MIARPWRQGAHSRVRKIRYSENTHLVKFNERLQQEERETTPSLSSEGLELGLGVKAETDPWM